MGRAWTGEQDWELFRMCDEGAPLVAIAKRLNRSVPAIRMRMRKVRVRRIHRPQGVYTACSAAKTLGIHYSTIIIWCEHMGLKHRVVEHMPGIRHFRIRRLHLIDWMADPINWIHYRVRRIADLEIRTYLLEVQATTHNPYLTAAQICQRYHVSLQSVSTWTIKGLLRNANPGGNILIHEDQLINFVPPHINRARRKDAKV